MLYGNIKLKHDDEMGDGLWHRPLDVVLDESGAKLKGPSAAQPADTSLTANAIFSIPPANGGDLEPFAHLLYDRYGQVWSDRSPGCIAIHNDGILRSYSSDMVNAQIRF